ncbi:gliding motility-associated protein GldE [Flavobacterium aciduliphilum]|uniref:Protein involved in gliding motility GldE n=1 Tax=Flavobacterium aciduliphilum TaxID=1101402 RepID=A0A328YKA4_9FLAO|nr:gliding motility-associated protein GldE [Flavobacterium aciduliphilum]RAR72492.1 protein involved in gliding motility GldE [Flavobacterium aciduliphilum]
MDLAPNLLTFSNIDTNLLFGIVGISILLFLTAMVAASEVALFSLSQKNISELSQKSVSKSDLVNQLLSKPKKTLATILVANNFLHISIVILFSFSLDTVFSTLTNVLLKFVVEVLLVTFLILLFGEVLPKIYASRNNVKFILFIIHPLFILDKLLSPISIPMRSFTLFIQEKLGKQKTNFSVNQLSQALELTSTEDTTQEEQKILEGIVSFGNTDTKQVMSPRIDIFALEIDEPFSEIIPKIIEKGYSRIPVYQDTIDQIKGVLFIKDLIPHINKKTFDWKTLIRAPFFVPENKKLDDLLNDFQNMKNHLAIVVDEYGGTSGLISLEDIIEEIVGDISDEFDEDAHPFTKIDDKNFIFDGKISLKDFYRIVEVDEDVFENQKGEAETLAGFILELLGNFPKKSQKIQFENCLFTIETVDKKRIKQIKVTLDV